MTIGSPHRFIKIKTWISENDKSVKKYSLFWQGKSIDELPVSLHLVLVILNLGL